MDLCMYLFKLVEFVAIDIAGKLRVDGNIASQVFNAQLAYRFHTSKFSSSVLSRVFLYFVRPSATDRPSAPFESAALHVLSNSFDCIM